MYPYPRRVLMVRPNGYRVEYAINPYMLDAQGRLHKVDSAQALAQWENLKQTFTRLGLEVEVIDGDPAFPDMVYCANQTFLYRDVNDQPGAILSRMHSEQRKGEVPYFQRWAENQAWPCTQVTDHDFEGGGDAIWNYARREILGGYGFRSEAGAYDLVENLTGAKVLRLKLVSEHFYHMDTALAVLGADTVAVVKEAFAPEALRILQSHYSKVIWIAPEEAKRNFAANCIGVDGRHVIVPKGAKTFVDNLSQNGFIPLEVDTGEFIKGGGAAFCMKQLIP